MFLIDKSASPEYSVTCSELLHHPWLSTNSLPVLKRVHASSNLQTIHYIRLGIEVSDKCQSKLINFLINQGAFDSDDIQSEKELMNKFGDMFEYRTDTMRRFFFKFVQQMNPADFDQFIDDNFSKLNTGH